MSTPRANNKSRSQLEQLGYTFHPGYVDQYGNFVFTIAQTTANLSDLIVSDFVLVDGGIMEPPKPSLFKVAAGFAIIGLGLWGVTKFLERAKGDRE